MSREWKNGAQEWISVSERYHSGACTGDVARMIPQRNRARHRRVLQLNPVLFSKKNRAVNLRPTTLFDLPLRFRLFAIACAAAGLLAVLSGCGRLHPQHQEMVYVTARQMYLHDRVAAVSNRVAEVTNGERLEVLEHGRRFLKVKTAKNQVGWIEEHAVIDDKTFDQFTQLNQQHKNDPVVATAVLRDDMYLHLAPGRDTQRFFLLPGNVKVELLVRASVQKLPPGAHRRDAARPPAVSPPAAAAQAAAVTAAPAKPTVEPVQPEVPPVMEDWWLVRDAQGHAGWLLGSRMDVDVPDIVGQYAEGQRIVASYVLTTIQDDNADMPNHEVPEYVMLLEPPKSGLPYDFDQVRVFTWSRNHHRYETAFRLRPIQGFLPVSITRVPGLGKGGGMVPAFGIKLAGDSDIAIDPDTGITRPANIRTINFEMLDTVVKRIGPDLAPIPTMHNAGDKKEANKAGKKSHK